MSITPAAGFPIDGRQSERALLIRRGVGRLMRSHGLMVIPELTLRSGRRADLIGVTDKGDIWIVEIKSSIEDFRADHKWPDYMNFCDQMFFATHGGVPAEIFPDEAGLMIADGFGAEILRDAPRKPLAAARRKATLLRFARSAAQRLHDMEDPGAAGYLS